jgi:tRNA(Ile)-lysidine synthase
MQLNLDSRLIDHLKTYPKIWLGLSGGLDSVVLLHLLSHYPQLKSKISAIHIHHGLSPNANQWKRFCESLCHDLGIELISEKVQLESNSNLEEQARTLRYGVFEKMLKKGDALVLAHHLDDQIETFFLNALRGTGVDGLAAMPCIYQKKHYEIVRPLLSNTRQAILEYAQQNQLSWIEDESNQNTQFSRNFLRQEVLPLIESKWQNYRQSLAHTITSCQEVSKYLNQDIEIKSSTLAVDDLKAVDDFNQALMIRKWFQSHEVKLPNRNIIHAIQEQMLYPKRLDHQAEIRWDGALIYVYRHRLYLEKDEISYADALWEYFPHPMHGVMAEKALVGVCIMPGDAVEIRYRKGGEKFFWNGHHRCLKKLLQAWGVPPFLRQKVPLIYVNGVLKAVVGYATLHEGGSDLYHFLLR